MYYLYNLYKPYLDRFSKREDGQGMAEYGLILALISIAVITVLGLMGDGLNDIFTAVKDKLVVPSSGS